MSVTWPPQVSQMASTLQEDPDVIEGDEEEVAMETTELTGEELLTRDYLATVSSLVSSCALPTHKWMHPGNRARLLVDIFDILFC